MTLDSNVYTGGGTDVQQEDTQKEKTQDGKDPQSKDKEINGSTFTAIIAGKDIETDELDAMIFLKVDKENKKFVVSVIPTSVEFSVDSYGAIQDMKRRCVLPIW